MPLDVDKVPEETANPNKYHPPLIVTFDDITPEQVAQPEFSLSGISCRPGGGWLQQTHSTRQAVS